MKWKMKKMQAKTAEIMIYGDISTYDWWGDEVTPQKFNDELKALGDVDEISVRINSNGGSVFAGVAIHSMLKRHSAKITVYVDGLAASIASVIAMAGDEIVMPNGSMLMIHNPWTIAMGNAKDFRKMADDLDAICSSMMDIYVARTGIDRDELTALLDVETWMSATQAVEKGFATRVEENSQPIAASLREGKAIINGVEMDWSKFKNAPKLPEAETSEPNPETAALWQEINSLKAQLANRSQNQPPAVPTPQPKADLSGLELEMRRLSLIDQTI
ncbi:head maturation protease, ClpP-related [Paenibacillus sp. EPM92]|uniref:head maturation protease, ClpP-related n=1 Tax=Paenibacillus sp. EPM92 TaxID=1561195 RepID=UPI001916823C|nr:head maturation protease, ClpP-related [Paenibacillus sp. EPM92]